MSKGQTQTERIEISEFIDPELPKPSKLFTAFLCDTCQPLLLPVNPSKKIIDELYYSEPVFTRKEQQPPDWEKFKKKILENDPDITEEDLLIVFERTMVSLKNASNNTIKNKEREKKVMAIKEIFPFLINEEIIEFLNENDGNTESEIMYEKMKDWNSLSDLRKKIAIANTSEEELHIISEEGTDMDQNQEEDDEEEDEYRDESFDESDTEFKYKTKKNDISPGKQLIQNKSNGGKKKSSKALEIKKSKKHSRKSKTESNYKTDNYSENKNIYNHDSEEYITDENSNVKTNLGSQVKKKKNLKDSSKKLKSKESKDPKESRKNQLINKRKQFLEKENKRKRKLESDVYNENDIHPNKRRKTTPRLSPSKSHDDEFIYNDTMNHTRNLEKFYISEESAEENHEDSDYNPSIIKRKSQNKNIEKSKAPKTNNKKANRKRKKSEKEYSSENNEEKSYYESDDPIKSKKKTHSKSQSKSKKSGSSSTKSRRKRNNNSDDESYKTLSEDESYDNSGAGKKKSKKDFKLKTLKNDYETLADIPKRGMNPINPLPGFIDYITQDEVVNPYLSPYGHVLGYDTWRRILNPSTEDSVIYVKSQCPFTKQKLTMRSLIRLTIHTIDEHRSKIKNL